MQLLLVLAACLGQHSDAHDMMRPADPDLRCGAYCLFLGLKTLDAKVSNLQELEAKLGQPTQAGYSLKSLADAAEDFGMNVLLVDTTLDDLAARQDEFVCIALLEGKHHYVNIYDISKESVFVADPPRKTEVQKNAFGALWSGKALLISRAPLALRTSYSWITPLSVVSGVCVVAVGLWRTVRRRFLVVR